MQLALKEKAGLWICILSLVLYCLLRIPFNLSVLGHSENEGFYFIFGQHFLEEGTLTPGRGLLFIPIYSLVIKIFGFNPSALISMHFLHTVVVVLIGVLLFCVVKKVLKQDLWAGLTVLFWLIFISAPIGSNNRIEILAHHTFEAELICILFSLFSLLFLLKSQIFESGEMGIKEKIFLVIAGAFGLCPVMAKPSGGVFLIAVVLWFFSESFKKDHFKTTIKKFLLFLLGVILCFFAFQGLLLFFIGDLFAFWRNNFLIGLYDNSNATSSQSLLWLLLQRTYSFNNIFLLACVSVFFVIGLLQRLFAKRNSLSSFCFLISIWGIGSICAIVIPGKYEPYYYHLVWIPVAIGLILGLYCLVNSLKSRKLNYAISLLVLIFFISKLFIVYPAYATLLRQLTKKSAFNQPQSFQDPVVPYDPKVINRHGDLQLADAINVLLPDKNDTFFVFNLNKPGYTAFNPLSYVYAKRSSPGVVLSEHLHFRQHAAMFLNTLQKDLKTKSPKLLVVSRNRYMNHWQNKLLAPFLDWFNSFLKTNYYFVTTLECAFEEGDKIEEFLVYENKQV